MRRNDKSTCPGRQMLSRPLIKRTMCTKVQSHHMTQAGGVSRRE